MTDDQRARSGLWDRTYQVGVVVRDLDRAKAFYERLGIGPFEEALRHIANDPRCWKARAGEIIDSWREQTGGLQQ